jgi:iron complex transport system substrate-binding protein
LKKLDMPLKSYLPQRIICLTEETTEWLYLLGEQHRIVGISGYTVRPPQARSEKPKVSAFLTAKIDQILRLKPDCVFGFSDLQADIASELIKAGIQVTVFNQRSISEIISMLYQVAAIVGCADKGAQLLHEMQEEMARIRATTQSFGRKPKVYFEEWDYPAISAIRWVSELIECAGGIDCFSELSHHSLGKDRIIKNTDEVIHRQPDIIIGSWCGKKFRPNLVAQRAGWQSIPAVFSNDMYEIKSSIILQPGPAALTLGVQQLNGIFSNWASKYA